MTASVTSSETYVFRLELTDPRGTVIAQRELVEADFNRATLTTYWNALRRGLLRDYKPVLEQARIRPRFATVGGEPSRAEGFRVLIPTPGGGPFGYDFSIRYFAAEAARLRAQFAPSNIDDSDSPLCYILQSFLDDRQPQVADQAAIELEPTMTMIPLVSRPLADFGPLKAWDDPSPSSMPILVARSVVYDACDEARRHPDREVGGLLLGNVCRDPGDGKVFAEVTCLVSGEGTTESTATTLTFTPDSFERARSMIALRASGGLPLEILVGWHHTHPFKLCRECPLPTPRECVDKILFFSSDDIQVMSTTFYQPFMSGLLSGVDPRLERALGHPPVRCFQWKHGEIVRGGFSVFED
jgi:hypothetical protein